MWLVSLGVHLTPEQIEKMRAIGLRLDRAGTFWHEGTAVTHPRQRPVYDMSLAPHRHERISAQYRSPAFLPAWYERWRAFLHGLPGTGAPVRIVEVAPVRSPGCKPTFMLLES